MGHLGLPSQYKIVLMIGFLSWETLMDFLPVSLEHIAVLPECSDQDICLLIWAVPVS